MSEPFLHAVARRWRNIVNAWRGIDVYEDEHGNRYVGPQVDAYLNGEDPS